MKNVILISTLFVLVLLSGCRKENEKPKVIYDAKSKVIAKIIVDTTQMEIADLPVQMIGTNYLIHPVADLNIYGKNVKTSYESTSSVNDMSFKISNYSDNEITGYLRNLNFQKVGSDSIKPLSDKPVLIQTATYLRSVSDKVKQQIMVYTLVDMDTNKDGKLDINDIKSIYLSEISGERFTKISIDFQELIDWNLIESRNSLYFRTIEDTNKNGKFDKNDSIHYHFVDLSNKEWKVSDYNPI